MVTTHPDPSNETGLPTVRAALESATDKLEASDLCFGHGSDSAWDEAVQLVLTVAGLPLDAGEEVLEQELSAEAWTSIKSIASQRVQERKPLAYLLGRAWFADLEFICDERALVPRSPLAEVIRHDYAPWWSGSPPARVLDLCCGGGSIGIAAAVYGPELSVVLADLSDDALDLARDNVKMHAVGDRVSAVRSDLFAGLEGEIFDIILTNPPYVDADDLEAMPAEFQAEPALGLGSGSDGLDHARRILATAASHLTDRGLLFLELGNSWVALEVALPTLALTWLEFADGGHGVLVATRDEVLRIAEAL